MNKRYDEMDISRGLAILAVILIHISSTAISNAQGEVEEGVAILINQIMRFAVPVFLLMSGWGLTFTKKYEQNYFIFIKTQLSKILMFYMIWNTIYYILTANSYSAIGIIKSLVLGSSYYHLYYVPLIVFFYLIYPLLFKVAKSNIGLLIILIVTSLNQLGDFLTGLEVLNNGLNVLNWIFYFVFGIWLANNFNEKVLKFKEHRITLTLIYVLMSLTVFIEAYITFDSLGKGLATTSMRPSVILLSIAFIMFVISINWKKGWLKNLNLKLAKASYGIYLSHALVLTVFERIWSKIGFSLGSIYYIILAFLIVTPLAYIISILMDKVEVKLKYFFKRQKPSTKPTSQNT